MTAWRGRRLVVALAAAVAVSVVAAPRLCATPKKLHVVAAEDFWGSLVAQVAGKHATVTSIITNPDTDPHDYEATPSDARAVASADYVVVNGIGYDSWAQKLLDANPVSGRKVLDVGKLMGIETDRGNPHQSYSPTTVKAVIERVAADLAKLDRADASYFAAQKTKVETDRLKGYFDLIASIKQKYSGTPVGATESMFAPLARDLGLDLVTPESFLDAVAEGSDPTSKDKGTVDDQIATRAIKVLVYNSQNATPDVKAIVKAAKAHHIPVTTMSETLTPRGVTFESWQSRQLDALARALEQAPRS